MFLPLWISYILNIIIYIFKSQQQNLLEEWVRSFSFFFLINKGSMSLNNLDWLVWVHLLLHCFDATWTGLENQWLAEGSFIFMWKICNKCKSFSYFLPLLFWKLFKMICNRNSASIRFRVIWFQLTFLNHLWLIELNTLPIVHTLYSFSGPQMCTTSAEWQFSVN